MDQSWENLSHLELLLRGSMHLLRVSLILAHTSVEQLTASCVRYRVERESRRHQGG